MRSIIIRILGGGMSILLIIMMPLFFTDNVGWRKLRVIPIACIAWYFARYAIMGNNGGDNSVDVRTQQKSGTSCKIDKNK